MVKKTEPDGSYTLYFAGMYEIRKNSGGTVTGTTLYYPAGHLSILARECTSDSRQRCTTFLGMRV
jgi:hypothetical protein